MVIIPPVYRLDEVIMYWVYFQSLISDRKMGNYRERDERGREREKVTERGRYRKRKGEGERKMRRAGMSERETWCLCESVYLPSEHHGKSLCEVQKWPKRPGFVG